MILIAAAAAACGVALVVAVGMSFWSRASSSGAGSYRHEHVSERGDVYPYAVYVPSSLRAGSAVPLIVVLHGCTMTADEMMAATGYNLIAERHRFVVLYPDVDATDADQARCWKGIWDPKLEQRGQGDAGAIAAMTTAVMAHWRIDRSRVYAIGISAGAFETAILGAEYPDLYAAIGIHSGAAYGGGQQGCLVSNEVPTATQALARAAFAAMGTRAHVMPIIVFHGDRDGRIPYQCGQQALSQWLGTDNLVLANERQAELASAPRSASHAATSSGHAYTVASYGDRSGCLVAQFWAVHGMGHFWSGGPDNLTSLPYSDPRGPSASAASWAFFSRWRLSGPTLLCTRGGP